jgi:hypothetical protein
VYVSLLIGLGGAVLAAGHPSPAGPIGMGLLLVGFGLLELLHRPAPSAERVEARPVLAP